MKYHSTITGWGENALFFLEDPDSNFIIIFNEDAPPELADISVLHTKSQLLGEPAPGDMMFIADKVFTIPVVGDEAKSTLRDLGHCTLVFKGESEPDRPGCIMLEGDEKLLVADIKEGATIEIH